MQPTNQETNFNAGNAPLVTGVPQGTASPNPVVENNQAPSKPKNNKKLIIVLVCIFSVLIVCGIVVAVVFGQNKQDQDEQSTTQEATSEVLENATEDQGELVFDIEEAGTAEVEDGTFSLKDEAGQTIVEDDTMANTTGIVSCESVEGDVQASVNCEVTTETGTGVYVYYPEDGVLKFADTTSE